jgi:hypothetical protein
MGHAPRFTLVTSDEPDGANTPLQENRATPQNHGNWRSTVYICTGAAFLVLIINIIVTILSSKHGKSSGNDGRQVLFEGDCNYAKKLNIGLHVLINALSTILLGSGNYCMQCLSAPTREELDKAHAKRRWLDVGVLSVRNLRGIEKQRVLLWWLLGLSSLPLHLL